MAARRSTKKGVCGSAPPKVRKIESYAKYSPNLSSKTQGAINSVYAKRRTAERRSASNALKTFENRYETAYTVLLESNDLFHKTGDRRDPYWKLVARGKALSRRIDPDFYARFCYYKGDSLTSDRELAAFASAYDRIQIIHLAKSCADDAEMKIRNALSAQKLSAWAKIIPVKTSITKDGKNSFLMRFSIGKTKALMEFTLDVYSGKWLVGWVITDPRGGTHSSSWHNASANQNEMQALMEKAYGNAMTYSKKWGGQRWHPAGKGSALRRLPR